MTTTQQTRDAPHVPPDPILVLERVKAARHERIVHLERALAHCQQVLGDYSKAMQEVVHGRPKPL